MIPKKYGIETGEDTRTYDKSVDVWLLGCMVFNMITGTPPFFESDPQKLYDKISKGAYKTNTPMFD